jgi:pimeloyl-ACP methyl ester carboxylesterase
MRTGTDEMKPTGFPAGAGGSESRPTVVLLHASASSSRQWNGLVARLSDRFDACALDFHGHGARPDWPTHGPLTLAHEVALVVPVLQAAGAVHLVGHSYGGVVALKLAQMFPNAVRSVAVYEPVLFPWLSADEHDAEVAHEVLDLADDIRKALHQRCFRRAAERFVDYWSGNGAWVQMSPARQQSIAMRMPAVLAHFEALHREDFSPGAALSSVPVLGLSGANSPRSTRRIARIVGSKIPHALCKELPQMGHMGPITHGAIVFDRIERFLTQCEAGHHARPALASSAPRFNPATRHSPSRAAPPPVRTPSPAQLRTASG